MVRRVDWLVTASFLALAFSGFVILMAHPRLSWGNVGSDDERESERRRMVDEQLRARDIHDARVLDAMLHVARHVFIPRHMFIPESARAGLQRFRPAHRIRPDHFPALYRRPS